MRRVITPATTPSTSNGTRFRGSAMDSRPGWNGTSWARKTSPSSEGAWKRRQRMSEYTADEMMTIAAARMMRNGATCFIGIGLPSAAANLARLTHAPDTVLIYESGTIGTKPAVLPLSIGDGELSETALTVVSVVEIFSYWLEGGRIDLGFLGAAQIDRFANINSTVIGDYSSPKVRMPGAGGAPQITRGAREIVVVLRQTPRSFVAQLDFLTTARCSGPTTVISDLGILEANPGTS